MLARVATRHTVAALFAIAASANVACSDDDTETTIQVPLLPAETVAYLDFWWQQGEGTTSQHLIVARASGEAARLVAVDLERSEQGWRQLFATAPQPLRTSRVDLALNATVFDTVEETIASRVEAELGGVAAFQQRVAEGLTDSDGSAVDVEILASALVVFPSALSAEDRRAFSNTLVFAHAGGRQRERNEGVAAAYGTTLGEVFASSGWVGSFAFGQQSADVDLVTAIAQAGDAEALFAQLGLSGDNQR
jgi:hypothetical protein